MKTIASLLLIIALLACNSERPEGAASSDEMLKTTITKAELKDKIKGGWVGQVIGCTFGGPTEFQFNGTMINDYKPIPWGNDRCLWYYENAPGLYDDVYMDLTFVDVFEKEGLDAPASSHAKAFANADYALWHANQAARYNILNGMMPPESGHWLNNPHADDIDFQIEADFAGLMAPGMVNTASEICDRVGHIMNYGDGWYGGVYVAAMYSLAFVSDDVCFVVKEALKAIPQESEFYQCISDVVEWHNQFPDDWKRTWFETEKKWSADRGCPDGVFRAFNIDAKINAAYIAIGLLYGDGDYSKTLEISTRCGQDSDCNPASAGGILGTMLGYSNIPEFWKEPVYPVEDMDFRYTSISLNDVYETGTKHALQVLELNGAETDNETIEIPYQEIEPVKLEVAFVNHFPVERKRVGATLNADSPEMEVNFKGNGFVLTGNAQNAEATLEVTMDNEEPQQFAMPANFRARKHEITWKYQLPEEQHTVIVKLLNPESGAEVRAHDLVVYSSEKSENTWMTD